MDNFDRAEWMKSETHPNGYIYTFSINGNRYVEVEFGGVPNIKGIYRKYSSKPINGFIKVMLNNGQYTFINVETNKMISESFDIAINENESGLVMVGNNGTVGWYNFIKSEYYTKGLCGVKVYDFKTVKDKKISRIDCDGIIDDNYTCFIDENGELMSFVINDGVESDSYTYSVNSSMIYDTGIKFGEYLLDWDKDGKSFNKKTGLVLYSDGRAYTRDYILNQIYQSNKKKAIERINKLFGTEKSNEYRKK